MRQPFKPGRIGPLEARVYRVNTEDGVEIAVTRLGNGSGDLTVVGVFRRTAGGRHAGDDKRNRPARHRTANHGGVVNQRSSPCSTMHTLLELGPAGHGGSTRSLRSTCQRRRGFLRTDIALGERPCFPGALASHLWQ